MFYQIVLPLSILLFTNLIVLSSGNTEFNFIKLLRKIKREYNFETIIIIHDSDSKQKGGTCVEFRRLESLLHVPVLLWEASRKHAPQKDERAEIKTGTRSEISTVGISSELALLVYCIAEDLELELLQQLLDLLEHMRCMRIIFYWYLRQERNQLQTLEQLQKLFTYCMQNYLPQVIGIFEDFLSFYTYKQFPQFEIEVKDLLKATAWFPQQRLLKLKGAVIRTFPAQSEPRTMVYRTKYGSIEIVGYAAKVIRAFAEKHQATLVYPLPIEPVMNSTLKELHNLVQRGELDILMSFWSPFITNSWHGISAITEQVGLGIMIPYSKPLTFQQLYPLLIKSWFVLIVMICFLLVTTLLALESLFILQGQREEQKYSIPSFFQLALGIAITATLRGILGQSMCLPFPSSAQLTAFKKFLFTHIFIIGIFTCTTFAAYLQTYFTSTPTPNNIKVFDDLLTSSLSVHIHAEHYKQIPEFTSAAFWAQLKPIFIVTANLSEYFKRRDSWNTNYGYTVTSSLWDVIERQQTFLTRPLFHLPEALYLNKEIELGIPLHEHSIYRKALNTFVSQLHESGLLKYWMHHAYDDMLTAGRINVPQKLLRHCEVVKSLKFMDLYWIWAMLGVGMALGGIAFIGENVYYVKFKRDEHD